MALLRRHHLLFVTFLLGLEREFLRLLVSMVLDLAIKRDDDQIQIILQCVARRVRPNQRDLERASSTLDSDRQVVLVESVERLVLVTETSSASLAANDDAVGDLDAAPAARVVGALARLGRDVLAGELDGAIDQRRLDERGARLRRAVPPLSPDSP